MANIQHYIHATIADYLHMFASSEGVSLSAVGMNHQQVWFTSVV